MASRRTGKRSARAVGRPGGRAVGADIRVSALVRSPLPRAAVVALAAGVLQAERAADAALSITFVGKARMRTLNRMYLGRDRETDVIAFTLSRRPSARPPVRPTALVGDVHISVDAARRQARVLGISPAEEVRRLVVHGVLHVLGYDHPEGAGRTDAAMWHVQERHLAHLGAR